MTTRRITTAIAAGTPASTHRTRGKAKATRRFLLAACLLAVLLTSAARAMPGGLDPTFGGDGKVTTWSAGAGALENAYALALQPDGNIVVAGRGTRAASAQDFGLARYKPDGSLDTSFNGTGTVLTAFGIAADEAKDLAVQPDGKLVAAGIVQSGSGNDFALARYHADGSLDASFSGTGKVITAISPGHDEALALVLQPDGKIVVAGRAFNGANNDVALARYNTNGSLDTSFNGTGKVTTAIGPSDDEAYALVLQPDGKVVAAGQSRNGGQTDFAVVRYNANGSLDTSFNGSGKVTTAIGSPYSSANALELLPDGKLVASGVGGDGSQFAFALARYNTNGSLDTTFNGTGKVLTAIGTTQDTVIDSVLQPDGKVVAAGYSYLGGNNRDFALARYNADGSLDSSFGAGGKLTTAIGPGHDEAYAVALQPDGKLLAAGPSWDGSRNVFALVRYLGNTLTVSKSGSGSGSVTSSPNGIDCGSSCSAAYAAAPVTLTATASQGSSFAGWSGDCSGTGPCTLTVSSDRAATAIFEADKTLALATAGSGTGTVMSSPAGQTFTHGTVVTLTAAASPRSRFAGWSGDCSGTGPCTLTMNAGRSVTAKFDVLCVVPKVRGKSLRAAKRALRKAHCAVGKVTRPFSAKVRKGRVISQKPKPGRRLRAGSKVNLVVSRGKKT